MTQVLKKQERRVLKHLFIALSMGFAFQGGLSLTASAVDDAGTGVQTESEMSTLHAQWTALTTEYVSTPEDGVNRFDYARLQVNAGDRAALDSYIDALADLPLSTLPDAERFAAYANLYNALTVRLIVEKYPVESITNIRPNLLAIGPWKQDIITIEGEVLSLDNIEHDILRVDFDDPRVHYAVNCASIGCPNLRQPAWVAETLNADLNDAARDYINHPRGVTIRRDGRLKVSNIYKWFREDFGDSEAGVVEHLLQHAEPELADAILARPDIADHGYDWSLNDIPK